MKHWLLAGTVLVLLALSLLFVFPPAPTGTSLPGAEQLLDGHQLEVLSGEHPPGELGIRILRTIPLEVLGFLVLLVTGGFWVAFTVGAPSQRGIPSLEPAWMSLTGTVAWLVAAFLGGLLVSQGLSSLNPPAFWLHWGAGLSLQLVLLVGVVLISLLLSGENPTGWLLDDLSTPQALKRGTLEFLRYYPYLLLALILNEILVVRFGTPSLPVSYRFIGAADSLPRAVLVVVLITVVAPLVEELFFRGIFYTGLRSQFSTLPSCLLAGGFFGLIHLEYQVILPLWVFGTILCYVYERSGSIKVVITMHFLQNTISVYMIQRFFG